MGLCVDKNVKFLAQCVISSMPTAFQIFSSIIWSKSLSTRPFPLYLDCLIYTTALNVYEVYMFVLMAMPIQSPASSETLDRRCHFKHVSLKQCRFYHCQTSTAHRWRIKVDGSVATISIKNFPIGLHVKYRYSPDTPRTSLKLANGAVFLPDNILQVQMRIKYFNKTSEQLHSPTSLSLFYSNIVLCTVLQYSQLFSVLNVEGEVSKS
jgi:hypothetical protein